jgi:hypothetical protein
VQLSYCIFRFQVLYKEVPWIAYVLKIVAGIQLRLKGKKTSPPRRGKYLLIRKAFYANRSESSSTGYENLNLSYFEGGKNLYSIVPKWHVTWFQDISS